MTENQKKPPPSPLNEGECSDGNDGGNVGKISFYTLSRLLIVTYSANVILRGF